MVEDLDGDGTEDHYDLDDDGDGLSDLDEAHFNSDPRDANSPAVPATSFVISQELNISEDADIGAVVGKFTELDNSASPIKSYELIPHLPTSVNPVLWRAVNWTMPETGRTRACPITMPPEMEQQKGSPPF